VDGEPVHDSTRILERIDALTGAFSRGIDAKTRAEAWLWEEFADTTLNGFLVAARWADVGTGPSSATPTSEARRGRCEPSSPLACARR